LGTEFGFIQNLRSINQLERILAQDPDLRTRDAVELALF